MPTDAFAWRGSWGVRASDDAGRAANSILIVAVYGGIAEAARRLALAELRARGGLPALQATASRAALAELEVALASARGALHTALDHLDAEITHTAPRSHPEATATALLADCVATGMIIERTAAQSVDLAMRLCGAKGFAMGSPLARLYRDVRAAGFMRPYAPPEAWVDFMVKATLGHASTNGSTLKAK
jgi:alkylation response protein AidB-like acyl-CoA dehydrogenase